MSRITIQCTQCKAFYDRWPYEIKNYRSSVYVCLTCIRSQRQERECKNCNKKIRTSPKEDKNFCSRSCSAIYNNKYRDKSFLLVHKTKHVNCKNCSKGIDVNIHAKLRDSLCEECKTVSVKEKNIQRRSKPRIERNLKKGSCNIHIKNCKVCNNLFIAASVKGNLERKTCSDTCKSIASVGIRTYQNGSRKPSWYFNKHQNKDVLLDSSWEVIVAKRLDELEIVWQRPKPIAWTDDLNKKRHYYPDFYLPSLICIWIPRIHIV